jgi:hypothetical protein
MKKPLIVLAVLVVQALVVLAALRTWTSRELILKRDGLPLANLKGSLMHSKSSSSFRTSTDPDGRLDLSSVPWGAKYILVSLSDDKDTVLRLTTFTLPQSGSQTVDFQGARTITTTIRTYADFILFKFTVREVVTCEQIGSPGPSNPETANPLTQTDTDTQEK